MSFHDPYYVHPQYEEGQHDARKELAALVEYLGGVIDDLGAHIVKDDGMTAEDHKMVALAFAALDRIKREL